MVAIDAQDLIEKNASDPDVYESLRETLVNGDDLAARFRALFALKNLGTDKAVEVIGAAIDKERVKQSALFKHELAYVLGQIHNISAIPMLESLLVDLDQHPMVRHEAAEALGAIGEPSSISILERFLTDKEESVRETCELAITLLLNGADSGKSKFNSRDPAPAFEASASIPELKAILLDESLPLYHRYQAMFSLRDNGSTDAVAALAEGLENGRSALFRHEIAFVFGQLLHQDSVHVLKKVLADQKEDDMVRHECAEALGSIATSDVLNTIEGFASRSDIPAVVRESCEVALDMFVHENDPQSFHYATTAFKE